jgi:hypothetical protein
MPYNLTPDIPRLYEAAQKAPSVFNNQPWRFRYRDPDRIELWLPAMREDEDRARAREYVISCGAALFNLRLAVRVAGHDLVLWLLPVPSYANFKHPQERLLARVEIVTGRIKKPAMWEQELYEAIWRRHTNRWPYFAPAPLPIIAEMEEAAAQEGARLRLLHRREARECTRREARAASLLAPPFPNLVSHDNYGPRPTDHHHPVTRRDFWLPDRERFERKPQLLALSTGDDQPVDWLRAGQAMERAILTATWYSMSAPDSSVWAPDGSESAPYGLAARYKAPQRYGLPARRRLWRENVAHYGLSVSPLTPPLEYDDETGEPRRWQRRYPLAGGADRYRARRWRFDELPQMILRVGYAAVRVGDEQRKLMREVWSPLPEQPAQRAPAPPDSEATI